MAIQTVSITLETDFESLVRSFRGKLDQKSFYELSSVVQAVRQWKELIDLTIGPVTEAKLHSNPDDPPDVTLVAGGSGRYLSVEHTDFNSPMRGYVNHLHLAEFPSSAIFLPPLAQRTPKTAQSLGNLLVTLLADEREGKPKVEIESTYMGHYAVGQVRLVNKQRRHQSAHDDEFVHQVAKFRGQIKAS